MAIAIEDVLAALENHEFSVEYMPIVSLGSKACVAAEALIRWRRDGVDLSPGVFIPEFEESAVIGLVTYWLIERVVSELGPWLRSHRDFHVSLNVPPELFGRGGLHHTALRADSTDLYPQMVLEVTERGALDRISLEGIRLAHRLGLAIAIDDVASEDLNLLLLARTKVDYVKIDKGLVDLVESGRFPDQRRTEVQQLAALGHPLLVAEGVETVAQARFLKELGVQLGQGWLFSRSLPLDRFLAFVPGGCRDLDF